MKALIVIDMLNDSIGTGANRNDAMRIVPSVRRLLDHARANSDWIVVYANDAHRAEDREVALKGRHAMAGTDGAMVIAPLAPIGTEREIVLPKRFYSAFDGTDLEDILFDYEVDELVLAGQPIEGGIAHTAYGAFCAGYGIIVAADAVCTGASGDEAAALERLVAMYGADLTTSTALIGRPVLRTAASRLSPVS